MNYGVVLPIWQLTIAEAEALAVRAEELGLDSVFVPDHILAKPATTQHYGGHRPDPFSFLAFLAGRTRDALSLAPRNLLDLTDTARARGERRFKDPSTRSRRTSAARERWAPSG